MAKVDSNLMARVLLANKLASKETLLMAMNDVTPECDIGQVLVEAGIIKPDLYPKLRDYVLKYQAQQAAKAAAARPQVVPQDGLGVPLDSMLESTSFAGGTEGADSVEIDAALQQTAFGGGVGGDPGAETVEGLSGSLLDAEGLDAFRKKVMDSSIGEITPKMVEVDDALIEMASHGEITWDDAARRCFDPTRFPQPRS